MSQDALISLEKRAVKNLSIKDLRKENIAMSQEIEAQKRDKEIEAEFRYYPDNDRIVKKCYQVLTNIILCQISIFSPKIHIFNHTFLDQN